MTPRTRNSSRLNGWMRLWIVLTAIWGLVVAVLAYDSRPTLADLYSLWASEAATVLAEELSTPVDPVSPKEVYDALHHKLGSDRQIAAWSVVADKGPKMDSVVLLHGRRLARFSSTVRDHYLKMLLLWGAPSLCLLGGGLATRWISRGFRPSPDAKD